MLFTESKGFSEKKMDKIMTVLFLLFTSNHLVRSVFNDGDNKQNYILTTFSNFTESHSQH